MKINLVNENFTSDYLANLLHTRGVENVEDFLNPPASYLSDPELLDNIKQGAKWLEETLNKENIKNTGIAYLVEAEKSVLQMESFSIPNCAVAVCGSKLNKYALDILMRECHPREIVICFDQEEEPGKQDYFNKLYELCNKYKVYSNFSFIYDKEKLLRLKDSPTDRGEAVFLKLLEKRTKVY